MRSGRPLGTAGPFNIVTEALTLRNFIRTDITRLYTQHAEQSGQGFPLEVADAVYEATQGQPWLLNAIAREITAKMLDNDTSQPILPEYVEQAIETIIKQRGTHIDSLMERLTEERVRKIVEPVILGEPQYATISWMMIIVLCWIWDCCGKISDR